MRSIVSIALAASLLAAAAQAQSIPNSPGWKLDRMEKDAEETAEGVVFEYADYFALYPNDTRPAITIDGGTATRILSGQATAESIYYARTNGAALEAGKQAESTSGSGAVGWQIAESTYVPAGQETNPARAPASAQINYNNLQERSGASASPVAAFGGGAAMPVGGATGVASSVAGGNGVTIYNPGGGGAMAAARPVYPSSAPDKTEPAGPLTYSQMIDKAMSSASSSLCGRMGAYAGAGQCK
ncbi:MAG: hypothetical protein AB7K68_00945 [Bacteriovoracia bacterium]